MKRTTKLAQAIAALTLSAGLAACGTVASGSTSSTTSNAITATSSSSSTSSTSSVTAANASTSTTTQSNELWSDNTATHAEADDASYDAAEAVTVKLSDSGTTASGSGVSVSGSTVTITEPGTYVLSGTLTDGQVVVNSSAEGKVRIVLAGASISNADGSAVVVSAADEAVIVLAKGTTNTVSDGSSYGDSSNTDDPNAAIYSMADLTITGEGTLNVKGNSNDGIASKDGLVIQSGTINVTAKDDGIRGKDYVIVDGGTINVTAEGDGIKADNETDDTVGYVAVNGGSVTISAGDDGIHAEGDLAVTDGTVTIKQSNEGLEGYSITLAGGATTVTASDDGVNVSDGSTSSSDQGGMGGGGMQDSGQYLIISGGTNVINSEGDGLDSNGSTLITGGTTVVNGPTSNGNGALDSNGGITVTGGTLVAGGSAGMAESPDSESTTGWLAVSFSTPVEAGTTVSIVSGDTVIASYTATKQTYSLVLAASGITSGSSYDVYVGGSLANDKVANFSLAGSTEGATKTGSVTAGQAIAGGGGGGGMR